MSASHSNFTSIIALALLVLPAWAVAAESDSDAQESEARHLNQVIVFLGNTQNGSSNGASLALLYRHRFTRLLSIGGYIERAAGDFETTAVGVSVAFHPHAGWLLNISPGVEFHGGETHAQVRLGVGYDFEITRNWSLTPEVNVGFVNGETNLIYGLAAGYGF